MTFCVVVVQQARCRQVKPLLNFSHAWLLFRNALWEGEEGLRRGPSANRTMPVVPLDLSARHFDDLRHYGTTSPCVGKMANILNRLITHIRYSGFCIRELSFSL